jgi:hypothetical protein
MFFSLSDDVCPALHANFYFFMLLEKSHKNPKRAYYIHPFIFGFWMFGICTDIFFLCCSFNFWYFALNINNKISTSANEHHGIMNLRMLDWGIVNWQLLTCNVNNACGSC